MTGITSMADFVQKRRDRAAAIASHYGDALSGLPAASISDMAATGEPSMDPNAQPLSAMDVEAFLGMRDWLERALAAQGAKTAGAGIGCGQADLDIELDGHRYNVSIRPLDSP